MIPGHTLNLGGTDYVVPPLNLGAIKQYQVQVQAMLASGTPDMELIGTLLACALRRNYPDADVARIVDEGLDFGNLFQVFEALVNVSGMAAQAGEMVRRIQQGMGAA